ncbi:MAG: hypothetical protein KDA75_08740, partial [Planctomycetaceae bacterium]|nr:hypothetical protein [Planctomycetaceae bacterium]
QAPFRADTVVAVLRSVVDDQHPTIADLSPEIPPSLAAIVDRLMSKDPADRFQSAGEAEAALTEALDEFNGAPPDARSAGMARKATHGARLTTRHWTAIAALAFLVLLAGFVVKITSRDGSTVEVTSPDGKPLQLNVGGTRIEIKADGGTSPLTPPSNRTGPDASSGESSPSRSPDLQAAEAVIALGGRVGVRTPDKSVFDVGPLAGIPDGAFQVI